MRLTVLWMYKGEDKYVGMRYSIVELNVMNMCRSNVLRFLPHVMMRPGFLPPPNLAMRFLPPQPVVLESGPSLYEDAEKKSDENEKEKEPDAGPSTMKTQALSSDVELVAQKKHNEAANRSSYIGQVLRGEKKMKRFLRCGGGQVWEDSSLAEWDPNDFRIFCGDLGNEVSDELLAKAFRKYPSFQKAKVIRESRTNKSKGYGFVSFKHQDDFVRACREMDGKYVGNRPIKLRKSNWRERNMEVVRKKQKQKQRLGLA
uniref:RNA-binding protein 42 n=1 Tax=Parascaris equorum TaxID=6256 RepID=A0A914S1L1_PAREQ